MLARLFVRVTSFAAAALLLLGACRTKTPTPEPPPEPAAATPDTSCSTAAACTTEATQAVAASDPTRAAASFGRACDLGDPAGCNEAGILLTDPTEQSARFRRGCELGDASACMNLGRTAADPREGIVHAEKGCALDARACDIAARLAIDLTDWPRARANAEKGCTDAVDGACGTLGALLARGDGGPQDVPRAAALLERACAAGDAAACKNRDVVRAATANASTDPAASDDLTVPHASLTMGSIAADGFTMTDLACELEGGGLGALMVGPVLAATIGKRKAALRKCAPRGGEARVLFTMRGGKTDARAQAATPAIAACVVKVMKTVPAVNEGTCAATFDLRQ
jgi:TPR repeat protein